MINGLLKHLKNFLLLIILLFSGQIMKAQYDGINFDHFDINNGLIQNYVEYIYVDSEGFVWLGTYAGLQRFDGYSFERYTFEPGNPNTISDNFIATISEDPNGNLWIGTQSQGLNMFDKELERFVHFKHDPDDPFSLSGNYFQRGKKLIVCDTNKNLWINTTEGLNKLDTSNKKIERFRGDFGGQLLYDQQEHQSINPL